MAFPFTFIAFCFFVSAMFSYILFTLTIDNIWSSLIFNSYILITEHCAQLPPYLEQFLLFKLMSSPLLLTSASVCLHCKAHTLCGRELLPTDSHQMHNELPICIVLLHINCLSSCLVSVVKLKFLQLSPAY